MFTKPKKEENNREVSEVNASQGEFTKVETDGTVEKTSEKLKETKVESGFEISNIETFGDVII